MFVKWENSRSSNHTQAFIDYLTENHCHEVAAVLPHNATQPIRPTWFSFFLAGAAFDAPRQPRPKVLVWCPFCEPVA